MAKKKTLYPNVTVHPGAMLADDLRARGMPQRELADLMGRTEIFISNIVRNRRASSASPHCSPKRRWGFMLRLG